MTDQISNANRISVDDLVADIPEFTPVHMKRVRHDGWTPKRQRYFIAALTATGTVDVAAQTVGMTRMAAYNLRKRPGAESFAAAWDTAIETGRARIFDYMVDRAVNGVTTLRLRLGGAIEISHGIDRNLVAARMKAPISESRGAP